MLVSFPVIVEHSLFFVVFPLITAQLGGRARADVVESEKCNCFRFGQDWFRESWLSLFRAKHFKHDQISSLPVNRPFAFASICLFRPWRTQIIVAGVRRHFFSVDNNAAFLSPPPADILAHLVGTLYPHLLPPNLLFKLLFFFFCFYFRHGFEHLCPVVFVSLLLQLSVQDLVQKLGQRLNHIRWSTVFKLNWLIIFLSV